MHASYTDIRALTDKEPQWYDENGVPRYCQPSHKCRPDIYAREVVFLEIACQACGRRFVVEMSFNPNCYGALVFKEKWTPFSQQVKSLHYGDPPRHDCVGDTMNCEDIRAVQFWQVDKQLQWKRRRDLEVSLES